MADDGSKYTDEQLEQLEKKIKKVYQEAYKDINDKLNTFQSKFSAKSDMYMQMVDDGKISWDDYSNWMDGQLFQMEQWESKRDQVIKVIQNANKEASTILNKGTINAFAENANWSHYQIEHDVGINFGFGLYDAHTVTNLIKNDPQLLPKWKINEKKDYKWNAKKLDNSITQGILQGEGLDDIMHRIANTLKSNNENLMLTFARTAMTGAQNAGRVQGLEDAKDLGINVVKVWMATLDDHTRASHQQMDGEEQEVGDKWHPSKFSNGCRYPGDPQGPPHEVYNCRCTLVSDVKDYPSEFKRYDNIDGVPVDNMTYKEWKEAKKANKPEPETNTEPDYSKFGGKDAFDVFAKYADFEDMIDKAPYDELDYLEKLGFDVYDTSGTFDESAQQIEDLIKEAHQVSFQQNPVDVSDYSGWVGECMQNPDVNEMLKLEEDTFNKYTQEQINALRTYTGSSYNEMNDYLRRIGAGESHDEAVMHSHISNDLLDAVDECHTALDDYRLDRDMILRRGTDLGDIAGLFMQGDFEANMDSLKGLSASELNDMFKGQVGTYFGFTSTSSQWDRGFRGRLEVVIKAPKGTAAASIMKISRFRTGEGETLLRDNTTVVCCGIEESDGHKGSVLRMFLEIVVD